MLFFGLALGGCALDLVTKELIFRWRGMPRPDNVWWVWEGYIGIETATNPGALFGLGAGGSLFFAALSVLAAIGILYWVLRRRALRDLTLAIALGAVLGGIVGNLYDRLGLWTPPDGRPHLLEVRDWILFRYGDRSWPNFNIADSLLVCGAGLLVAHGLLKREPARDAATASPATASAEASAPRSPVARDA